MYEPGKILFLRLRYLNGYTARRFVSIFFIGIPFVENSANTTHWFQSILSKAESDVTTGLGKDRGNGAS